MSGPDADVKVELTISQCVDVLALPNTSCMTSLVDSAISWVELFVKLPDDMRTLIMI